MGSYWEDLVGAMIDLFGGAETPSEVAQKYGEILCALNKELDARMHDVLLEIKDK